MLNLASFVHAQQSSSSFAHAQSLSSSRATFAVISGILDKWLVKGLNLKHILLEYFLSSLLSFWPHPSFLTGPCTFSLQAWQVCTCRALSYPRNDFRCLHHESFSFFQVMSMFIVMAGWDLDITIGMNKENNGEMWVLFLASEETCCVCSAFRAFCHSLFQGYISGGFLCSHNYIMPCNTTLINTKNQVMFNRFCFILFFSTFREALLCLFSWCPSSSSL